MKVGRGPQDYNRKRKCLKVVERKKKRERNGMYVIEIRRGGTIWRRKQTNELRASWRGSQQRRNIKAKVKGHTCMTAVDFKMRFGSHESSMYSSIIFQSSRRMVLMNKAEIDNLWWLHETVF